MWQKLQNYVAEPYTFPLREAARPRYLCPGKKGMPRQIFVPRERRFAGDGTHLKRKNDLGHRKKQTPCAEAV